MAEAARRTLGDRLRGGLVVGGEATPAASVGFDYRKGGHPVPTTESEQAGRRALELVGTLPPNERLLILLSGGASALMAVPAEGLTLEDKQLTTEGLLRGGADIHALNTVRKHLSAIKGGQLAARASVPCRTLAISDVVGDDLSVIGSGPTVADASTFQDALDVLTRFGGDAREFPARVTSRLRRGVTGDLPETPKPRDARLARAEAAVIGGRHDAMRGASDAASALGYHVVVVDQPVIGEARTAARKQLDGVARIMTDGALRPVCLVSSGETTVHVTGNGKGGRNQEFALALVESFATLPGTAAGASLGTDGIDGPTDAAGAIVDSSSAMRAQRAGLFPSRFLDDNNAYAFFSALGDLINTGPTGTNVGDLQVILLA